MEVKYTLKFGSEINRRFACVGIAEVGNYTPPGTTT